MCLIVMFNVFFHKFNLNLFFLSTILFKGQVGDWKNYFTVAMSEEFDKWYKEGMKNSKLNFKFS